MSAPKKLKDLGGTRKRDYTRDSVAPTYDESIELQNLLLNAVTIRRKDSKPMPKNIEMFIKRILFDNGVVGYDRLVDKWAYVSGTNINEIGDPYDLRFNTANDKTWTRKAYYEPDNSGAYFIKCMPIPFSLFSMITYSAYIINTCTDAINQNVEACKTPYIVVCKDEDTRLSLEQAIQEKQKGQAAIVVSADISEGLKGISIATTYIADKLEILREQERDKLLNKLGILTANTNKRERVQVGEVNATIGQCSDYIYLVIDTFNEQMKTYDLPFEMSFNGSLEEIYTDSNETETNEGDIND